MADRRSAGEGPLRDVLEVIDAKPLGYARDIGIDPARVAGRVETRLHFRLPLVDALKLAQVDITVEARPRGSASPGSRSSGHPRRRFRADDRRIGGAAARRRPLRRHTWRLNSELLFQVREGPRARYRVAASLDDAARRRLGFEVAPARPRRPDRY